MKPSPERLGSEERGRREPVFCRVVSGSVAVMRSPFLSDPKVNRGKKEESGKKKSSNNINCKMHTVTVSTSIQCAHGVG